MFYHPIRSSKESQNRAKASERPQQHGCHDQRPKQPWKSVWSASFGSFKGWKTQSTGYAPKTEHSTKIQMALTSLSMRQYVKQPPIRLATSQNHGQEKLEKGRMRQLAIPEVLEYGKEEVHS